VFRGDQLPGSRAKQTLCSKRGNALMLVDYLIARGDFEERCVGLGIMEVGTF
jgi:hypothetical protein